jgi:hypothetical protein
MNAAAQGLCTPAVVTAALFTALIFLDLFRREYHLLPGHGIFGIIATLLMAILCQNNVALAAWGLLAVPFVFLLIGWMIWAVKDQQPSVPYRVMPAPAKNPCESCNRSCDTCRCRRRLCDKTA